ncbi:MAG: urea ABC transporter ATP-binding subunit UrtE [Proteobacteria bacterium]|nr:MAG: urea ABC transporter ATP-binding subunit UrtE [Pseudomonadota bacterium]
MLTVDGLDQYYGQSHTLRAVDLDVEKGNCTCVMGRNGVGKTTLLKSMLGLVRIRSGRVRFNGEDIDGLPAEKRCALGIGYVPQGRQIFPLLTVAENLEVGLTTLPRALRVLPDMVHELFPVLGEMKSRRGGDLSGGQQQQLAIGRALAIGPELLILDEPTEGIQPNVVAEIADVIQTLKQSGMTVLLVEQKLPFVRKVADRFVIMDRGRVVAAGAIDRLDDDLIREYLTV